MKHRSPAERKEKKEFFEHSKKYRLAYLMQVNELYGDFNDGIKEEKSIDKSKKIIP